MVGIFPSPSMPRHFNKDIYRNTLIDSKQFCSFGDSSRYTGRCADKINICMKSKYGLSKVCLFCGTGFVTRPRMLEYCSQACKNPQNRPGNVPWNKGMTMSDEFKQTKMNMSGLSKGHGWNKGLPNEIARKRFLENNPNKDGRVNNMRPKNYIDDEFSSYKRQCRKATYRSVYKMKQEGLVPSSIGKHKHQYQLDHIIPFRQGFELGIDPEIIGGRKNLRYILGEENRSKWDRFQSEDVLKSVLGEQYGLLG